MALSLYCAAVLSNVITDCIVNLEGTFKLAAISVDRDLLVTGANAAANAVAPVAICLNQFLLEAFAVGI